MGLSMELFWSMWTAVGISLPKLWEWFNTNSGGVQAVGALITLFVTLYLVRFTARATHTADEALKVSQRQFAASLHPQVLPRIETRTRPEGLIDCHLSIQNAGGFYFKLVTVTYRVHCRTARQPIEWGVDFGVPEFAYRIVPAGDKVTAELLVNPMQMFDHEPHDGVCNWILDFCILTEDLYGHDQHAFYFDNKHGIKAPPDTPRRAVNPSISNLRHRFWKARTWLKTELCRFWSSSPNP